VPKVKCHDTQPIRLPGLPTTGRLTGKSKKGKENSNC